MEQKPSVSRMVHYTSYGTPGGEYLPACRAAVVTEVHGDGTLSLFVMNPTGVFLNQNVQYDDLHQGGTWHWPERV